MEKGFMHPHRRRTEHDLDREEIWLREQLRTLDHVPPSVTAQSIMARARKGRDARRRLAAGFILALAASGAAYAAPGSPLPGAIDRLIHTLVPAKKPTTQPALDSLPQAGIAVPPGERFIVEFASAQAGDTADVSLIHGDKVVVKVLGGATTFVSEAERLVVRHEGTPGKFQVQVPRDAPSVKLVVGDRPLWVKQGSRIDGPDVLPLSHKASSPAPGP
jgi:hypothetical protein